MTFLLRGSCVNTGYLRFVGSGQYVLGERDGQYEGGQLDNQGSVFLSYGAELIRGDGSQLIGNTPEYIDEPVYENGGS